MVEEGTFREAEGVQPGELVGVSLRSWLAGVFEPGGSVSISVNKRDKSGRITSVTTRLSYNGKAEEVKSLRATLGNRGRTRPAGDGSFNWWLASGIFKRDGRPGNAILLAREMLPRSLRRRDQLSLINNLHHYDARGELSDAVERSKQLNGKPQYPEIAEYLEVIKEDKAFLAGVVDSRGKIEFHERRSEDLMWKNAPDISIFSKNRPLLLALQKTYGGSVVLVDEKGTEVIVGGKVTGKTRDDSFAWKLADEESLTVLLGNIRPFVRFENRKREIARALGYLENVAEEQRI